VLRSRADEPRISVRAVPTPHVGTPKLQSMGLFYWTNGVQMSQVDISRKGTYTMDDDEKIEAMRQGCPTN